MASTCTNLSAHLCPAGGVDGDEALVTKDIGLPSTKPLLQLYAERLLRIQRLSTESLSGPGSSVACPTQWYIMASAASAPSICRY